MSDSGSPDPDLSGPHVPEAAPAASGPPESAARRPNSRRAGIGLALIGIAAVAAAVLIPTAIRTPEEFSESGSRSEALGSMAALVIPAIIGIAMYVTYRDRSRRPRYLAWSLSTCVVVVFGVIAATADPPEEDATTVAASTSPAAPATQVPAMVSTATAPPPTSPAAPTDHALTPEDEKYISELAFVTTVRRLGVSVHGGRPALVDFGYRICERLAAGQSPLRVSMTILETNPTWTPTAAASVVGAAQGTLCEETS